ncbi:hypothetical protein [Microbispora sp. NPDC049125]|uniref:hypothetical protein n=1 Tax=Microbispora sp. NPDC049125 TaxID=3154929 RepID=UPI003467AB7F
MSEKRQAHAMTLIPITEADDTNSMYWGIAGRLCRGTASGGKPRYVLRFVKERGWSSQRAGASRFPGEGDDVVESRDGPVLWTR